MAFLLSGSQGPWRLSLLIVCSSCLYLAGMTLNDVFDVERDRRERPNRPIPAGHVTLAAAKRLGYGLLATGILMALIVGLVIDGRLRWLPVVSAMLLSALILLYDSRLKSTALGPPLMGSCRFVNILLASSTCAAVAGWSQELAAIPTAAWWIATSIGVLITGITWFSKDEAIQNEGARLWLPGLLILIGLVGVAALPYAPSSSFSAKVASIYPWMILLIAIPIVRNVLVAIRTGEPSQVQQTVISVLRSLIIFDAAICLLAAPAQPFYCVAVLALIVPAILLGRWVSAT